MNPWAISLALGLGCLTAFPALPQLKVSDNKRFLITSEGRPFFWLGDTAWELFHRLNREEAVTLIRNRAEKKFTILQSVAIAELEGHTDPNAYGHLPFLSTPRASGIPLPAMFGAHSIGISSRALLDTRTAIIRYGRCGHPASLPSTLLSCPGRKR